MRAREKRVGLTALLFALIGCGYGQFQTARTTPPGEADITIAQQYVHNENVKERGGVDFSNFPSQVDVRVGLGEQVDLGAKLFFVTGLLADVKVNLIANSNDFALSPHGGIGLAYVDPMLDESTALIVHLPLGLIVSYRFFDALSPYLGLDYGFYWIFDRELDYRDPDKDYAERAGYGDGVARLSAGVEWEVSKGFALLVEYDLLAPLVDDPGDNFAFVTNHIAGVGVRF